MSWVVDDEKQHGWSSHLSALLMLTAALLLQATKIFVNGIWVGVHRDPQMLVRTLRQMRRQVSTHLDLSP